LGPGAGLPGRRERCGVVGVVVSDPIRFGFDT